MKPGNGVPTQGCCPIQKKKNIQHNIKKQQNNKTTNNEKKHQFDKQGCHCDQIFTKNTKKNNK